MSVDPCRLWRVVESQTSCQVVESLTSETVITIEKRPFPDDEVGNTDEEEVETEEGQSAVAAEEGSNSAQTIGKKRRRKTSKQRVKIKKRDESERIATEFRSRMSTDKTYEGVISHVDPRFPHSSVRIEGTPPMGVFNIPADTLYGVGQTMFLRVMPKTA